MTELSPQQLDEVKSLVLSGSKIAAIKVYRTHAHCDLLTAKQAVDALQAKLQGEMPEMSVKPSSGCFGMMVAAVGALGFAAWTASGWLR